MRIKRQSKALSQRAKVSILNYINKHDLQPNDALPTEPSLMEMLGVSRYTVREALALLEQESVIYKVQGKGTFLRKKPLQIQSGLEKLISITEIIEGFGFEPSTQWIAVEVSSPSEDMVEKLELSPDEKVVTFKRLRKANGIVASYCVDTMSMEHFESVPHDIKEQSLFHYLEDELGIYIESAIANIIPTTPTDEMVEEIGVGENQMFLLLHQIHYDSYGKPVIYSYDYFNPEVITFKINRTR